MARFVASKPFYGTLSGLNLIYRPTKVTFYNTNSDHFIAERDGDRIKVFGDDLKYFFGKPKAEGTFTGAKFSRYGEVYYKLTDADVPFKFVATNVDSEKITKQIFAKDDVFVGSSLFDKINGYSGNDKLLGRGGPDKLRGGDGNDVLDGGKGPDKLDGGKGKDSFRFTADPATGVDTVVNFQKGDRIELSKKMFGGFADRGRLDADAFFKGTGAHDADDRVIYNPETGYLIHDRDGTGPKPLQVVAIMPKHMDFFSAHDIFVI